MADNKPSPKEFRARGPRSWSPLQPGSTYEPDEDRYWLERELSGSHARWKIPGSGL